MATIFKMFMLPKLIYASPAWSLGLTATHFTRLKRTQKKAVKNILVASFTTYDIGHATQHVTTLTAYDTTSLKQFGLKLSNSPRHRAILS